MSTAQISVSQGSTGDRTTSHDSRSLLTYELSKMVSKSSPRFGALSHHSFFSRHNPHPHRVTHIQGLNGRPVCTVKDDWWVTTSLFPHPLIKSQILRSPNPPFTLPLGPYGANNKSALLSEAWREELKELAEKVNLSSKPKSNKKEQSGCAPGEQDPLEDGFGRRKTQYSAQTGRIIPPSTRAHRSRSNSMHPAYQPLHDQELMVLELLCQILQTDSLSLVQRWLLFAGQREKDLVMRLLQQALEGFEASGSPQFQQLQPLTSLPARGTSFSQSRRTTSHMPQCSDNDRPERIGDAEVLEIIPGSPENSL